MTSRTRGIRDPRDSRTRDNPADPKELQDLKDHGFQCHGSLSTTQLFLRSILRRWFAPAAPDSFFSALTMGRRSSSSSSRSRSRSRSPRRSSPSSYSRSRRGDRRRSPSRRSRRHSRRSSSSRSDRHSSRRHASRKTRSHAERMLARRRG